MIRVILVDDEPFLLQMLESSIAWEQYGMSVIGTFYNGKQALEYIRENEVDAVICDIMMPVMDGMALLRELKRMDYPAEFVVLSAYRDFELVRDFFRVGIFDYLTKIDIDSPQTAEVLSRLSLEIKMKKKRREYGAAPGFPSPDAVAGGGGKGTGARPADAFAHCKQKLFIGI